MELLHLFYLQIARKLRLLAVYRLLLASKNARYISNEINI